MCSWTWKDSDRIFRKKEEVLRVVDKVWVFFISSLCRFRRRSLTPGLMYIGGNSGTRIGKGALDVGGARHRKGAAMWNGKLKNLVASSATWTILPYCISVYRTDALAIMIAYGRLTQWTVISLNDCDGNNNSTVIMKYNYRININQ